MGSATTIIVLTLLCSIFPAATSSSSNSTSNPFEKGCLYSRNLTSRIRVCNSDDPAEASIQGICRPPPMDYREIRVVPSDWESSIFGSWIVQIVLSEILNVPATIETGDAVSHLSFYDPLGRVDIPYQQDVSGAMETVYTLKGDCSKADKSAEHYQACGHFVPESWGAYRKKEQDFVERGIVEPPRSLGMLANEGWYIPKFTAERDPSLLSYIGLQGENNRKKLAERFKRPTTWEDYCNEVSPDHCATPNEVAQRPPWEDDEKDHMFVQDLYTGHFRATEKNNCTTNPTNCTGHFTDYPCSWRSPVPTQIHFLNISLDANEILDQGGYTIAQLPEIWRAANATRSDVMMYWWSPERFFSTFAGTDAEFVPVILPPTTRECLQARTVVADHCATDLNLRVGRAEGVCGEPTKGLHTFLANVFQSADATSVAQAIQSPSQAALANYQLSELQVGEIFALFSKVMDPRRAICDWLGDNMEYLESVIPATFPRTVEQREDIGPLVIASTALGASAVAIVILACYMLYRQRTKLIIQLAQIDFLVLLLMGALLVALGAVVMGAPSSNTSCVFEIWLINIGYTLELTPLITKVAGVNHIMKMGRNMRRAKINRTFLLRLSSFITFLVIVYLILWTVLDPPLVYPDYELTEKMNDEGETIVWVLNVCASQSRLWRYFTAGWHALLLLCSTILAIQMRKISVQGFSESPTLGLLVYSHFMFVILRIITFGLSPQVSAFTLARCRSIIFSVDTIATIVIYFLPKFAGEDIESISSLWINPSSRRMSLSNDFGVSQDFSHDGTSEKITTVGGMDRSKLRESRSGGTTTSPTKKTEPRFRSLRWIDCMEDISDDIKKSSEGQPETKDPEKASSCNEYEVAISPCTTPVELTVDQMADPLLAVHQENRQLRETKAALEENVSEKESRLLALELEISGLKEQLVQYTAGPPPEN